MAAAGCHSLRAAAVARGVGAVRERAVDESGGCPVPSLSASLRRGGCVSHSEALKEGGGEPLAWSCGSMWRIYRSGGEGGASLEEEGPGGRSGCGLRKGTREGNLARTGKAGIQARLFGPAIFEAHKLRVLFLNVEEDRHPRDDLQGPRTYTLTHSDVTSKLTLAVAREFNKAQFGGWYSRLQRDEVLAVWRSGRGPETMALHVHCHISGGHLLLNAIARLRFWIFRKELPVVLEAFRHGDRTLFSKHPDLELAPVWVHFHSNIAEFNRRECWGPLATAAQKGMGSAKEALEAVMHDLESAEAEGGASWPSKVSPATGAIIPRPIFADDEADGCSSSSRE